MNCQEIQNAINELKVNSRGAIRGKNKAIDKLHALHLKKLDSELMDIRVYVAKISAVNSPKDIFKKLDEFIYNKQIK